MKLLASDYDGTFKSDLNALYININAIKKFMSKGNKFALVTGRSYLSIKEEINRYNIKYDYLSCNNGLITFDKNDRIVDCNILSKADLKYISSTLNNNENVKDINYYGFFDATDKLQDILEVYVKFNNVKSATEYKEYIKFVLTNVNCYQSRNKLFIGTNLTKANAVSIIQDIENIDFKDIYTIGDASNDIDMLEKYNGHKMLTSYPCLWFKKMPVTREVYTLVKKINK